MLKLCDICDLDSCKKYFCHYQRTSNCLSMEGFYLSQDYHDIIYMFHFTPEKFSWPWG